MQALAPNRVSAHAQRQPISRWYGLILDTAGPSANELETRSATATGGYIVDTVISRVERPTWIGQDERELAVCCGELHRNTLFVPHSAMLVEVGNKLFDRHGDALYVVRMGAGRCPELAGGYRGVVHRRRPRKLET